MEDQNNAPVLVEDAPKEVELFREVDGRTVLDVVPRAVKTAIEAATAQRRDLFLMDETTLYRSLKERQLIPTPTDNRVRLKFWDEYDRSMATNTKMCASNVYLGVTTSAYFHGRFLSCPEKVAWMMCPPANYEVKMEEALAYGIEQMRDILAQSHVLPNGRVDSKLAELKAKIVSMLDIRVKGAIVHKVENRSMNVNVNTTDNQVARQLVSNTMEDIERRLQELAKRDRKAALAAEATKQAEILDDSTGE